MKVSVSNPALAWFLPKKLSAYALILAIKCSARNKFTRQVFSNSLTLRTQKVTDDMM